jgi:AcrR family transcriptional regulator
LRRVALAQFASKGFANVTVTQLASEAGVTERTFFRHFRSKEAVLFQDYETQLEWLAEALAQRPTSESLFDAVLASVQIFPHDLEVVRQAAIARSTLISAERVAGHLRVVQSSFAQVLTEFIRTRYAGIANLDLVAEVAGATLAAALVTAVQKWGDDGCTGDLGEIVAASVDLVRSGLAPLA